MQDGVQATVPGACIMLRHSWLSALTSIAALAGCASASGGSAPLVWSITVLGDSSDLRFTAVQEATQYWNRELEAIGSRLRFGPVTSSSERVPEQVLQALSATVSERRRAQP